MPTIYYPKADQDRLDLLEQMGQMAIQDEVVGVFYLMPPLRADISAHFTTYKNTYQQFVTAQADYGLAVEQKDKAWAHLRICIRDFREALVRRIRRWQLTDDVLTLYRLPAKGTDLNSGRIQDWLTWADHVMTGESLAIRKGYLAMANPDVGEVEEALTTTQTAYEKVLLGLRDMDLWQNKLVPLREQADDLIRAGHAQLNAGMYNFAPDDARRIKRLYGFKYTD